MDVWVQAGLHRLNKQLLVGAVFVPIDTLHVLTCIAQRLCVIFPILVHAQIICSYARVQVVYQHSVTVHNILR